MHYALQPIDSFLIVVVFAHKIRANLSISILVEMPIQHEVYSSRTVTLLKCESKFIGFRAFAIVVRGGGSKSNLVMVH